jgi:hypothetical protein
MPGAKEEAQGRDLILALKPQDRGNPLAWTGSCPMEAPVLLLESGGSDEGHAWRPGRHSGTT